MPSPCHATIGPFAALLLLLSCPSGSHRIEPYKSDPVASEALQAKATRLCQDRMKRLPPLPMVTDGCTVVPEWGQTGCCVRHDIDYWCGGSSDARKKADEEFRSCVIGNHKKWWGTIMYSGVRLFGVPWLPTGWRWGYGFPYAIQHGYEADPMSATGTEPQDRGR